MSYEEILESLQVYTLVVLYFIVDFGKKRDKIWLIRSVEEMLQLMMNFKVFHLDQCTVVDFSGKTCLVLFLIDFDQ